MDNESFIRYRDDMVESCEVCVENVFEIVSFVVDCFGSWTVTFYVYVNNI